MDNFINFLNVKIVPVANKMGAQRHMMAIRKGIISTLPLTIVGSFFTIINNIPIEAVAKMLEPYKDILDIPFRYTVGILALYAAFGIASSLADYYKLDKLTNGTLAVLAFLISAAAPIQVTDNVKGVIDAGRYINIANLSASSLFASIVTGLLTVEIYRFFKEKNITIKMPAGVPPEVSNSFVALFPAAFILLFFWFIRYVLNFNISTFLTTILMPLKGVLVGNSLFGGLLTILLITGFWTLGIHGAAILAPITRPFWEMSIAQNMGEFTNGTSAHQLSTIFTEQFLQWFLWIGGAGGTLALVVLFMFSKSAYLKDLGKLSFLPGLFNINEPIIFGAPIVMNPILGIPFILGPLVTGTLSYVLTITGVVPMMMARLPFTVPSPLGAFVSTDWSIPALILVFVNFLIDLAIYYPFFKVFEKQQLEKE
ncbi:PTS sugar transporter subunit IIC [Companilactobacillus pabuli]|jgi:PTS system, lactose/cellobiose family IIC component|uniref:Permease IIC component n=1 Tax=Companilactobacillus pabuli TaxID=2714036 RepID=A0A7L7KYS6_9LACO|nr:PTS transporter subunit EIIC [Companilactobacillus pabuli]AKP02751.1 PTS cellbiose transporter subunit IIC [Companilactobacillus farciminis]AKS51049.1 PTS cellbiose transporter subunit IIC [Companilactobacillus farciminis]MDG5114196.1 PTS transporter subunit EIIC [Companilactobacillus pabuli]QMT84933.1 PTS sugar transporter subunit IIC [Companilactobacillus pabuli]